MIVTLFMYLFVVVFILFILSIFGNNIENQVIFSVTSFVGFLILSVNAFNIEIVGMVGDGTFYTYRIYEETYVWVCFLLTILAFLNSIVKITSFKAFQSMLGGRNNMRKGYGMRGR